MKQAELLIRILIAVCFFTTSTLSYAAEVSSNEKKGQMPPSSESTGDAQNAVDNKNALNEAEKEQPGGEDQEKESEDSKAEDEEEETESSSTLKTQASQSDTDTIQGWLENLIGRALYLNNANDQAILDFWSGLLDQGYTLNQVQSLIDTVGVLKDAIDFWYNGSFFQMGAVDLEDISDLQALFNWANLINLGFTQLNVKMMVILADIFMQGVKDNLIHRDLDVRNARDIKIIAGWAQYMREGYSGEEVYNLFKNQMSPSITALLGSFDIGFFTFMAEEALSKVNGGLDYICSLLDAMAEVKDAVEALIGPVDILNPPYQDNGFLTYWAEKATSGNESFIFDNEEYIINWSIQYVKDFLAVVKDLNTILESPIDYYDPNSMGMITDWIHYVLIVKGVKPGDSGYNTLLQEVKQRIEDLPEIIAQLMPSVISLFNELGLTYDDSNGLHHGYLMFWVTMALSGDISLTS
ncbi:MAG: hypothetical protein P9L98_05750, partial [Candidatus Kaelpia imicola]|nr:hypothetical protein [Candidatus Kaelpia imicola]